jgi:hypothetical protein
MTHSFQQAFPQSNRKYDASLRKNTYKQSTEATGHHGHRELRSIHPPPLEIPLSAHPSHMRTEYKIASHSGVTHNGLCYPRFKIKLRPHMSSRRTQQLHVTTLPITGLGQDPMDCCWLGVTRVRRAINQTALLLHSRLERADRTNNVHRRKHDNRGPPCLPLLEGRHL